MSSKYSDDFPKISKVPQKGRGRQKFKNTINTIKQIDLDKLSQEDYELDYEEDEFLCLKTK
jgi:hypothetical protein